MPSLISAGTSTNTAVSITGDTSGALAFATNNGTTAVTITTGQNVGIGTASPAYRLQAASAAAEVAEFTSSASATAVRINNTNANGWGGNLAFYSNGTGAGFIGTIGSLIGSTAQDISMYATAGNGVRFYTNGNNERMRINSDGNVGIGTSTASNLLTLGASGGPTQRFTDTASGVFSLIQVGSNGDFTISADHGNTGSSTNIIFKSDGAAERMRIDSSGNLLVGTTAFQGGATRGFQLNATGTSSGTYAQLIKNGDGTEIFQMRCNGGLGNYSANNANLSDERVKNNIELAGSYLNKICAIPVKTFKYKNQTDDLLNLGVIAQDVEAIAPELVDIGGFGETPEDGIPLKAIYQTDLQYALMKCIQELKAIVDTQATEIAALKAKVGE
jgi:hypothetical protein